MKLSDLPKGIRDAILASIADTQIVGRSRRRAPSPPKLARESKEDLFAFHARDRGLAPFERQYLFAEKIGRRWRFDFAWPDVKLAVEIDGLVLVGARGRHQTIDGMREDFRKGNAAVALGWFVLHFEQSQVKSGEAVAVTAHALDELRRRNVR